MKKTTAFAALLSGAAIVFTACSPEPWEIEPKFVQEKDLSKIVIHKDLQDQITITRISSMKTETGLLSVAINARDKGASVWQYIFCSYKMSRVKYRLDWIKGGKAPQTVTGKWQYLELKPGYKFGAIYESDNKDYADFRFYMEPVTEQEWAVYMSGKKADAKKDVKAAPAKNAKKDAKAAPAKNTKKDAKAAPAKTEKK